MLLMRRLAVIVLCLLLGTLVVPQVRADAVTKHRLTYDDVEIEVLAEGNGPAVVILPSLGRSARDYDEVSRFLAEDGFRVLRPQPRGIEGSTGPLTHITLHDFAKDIAKVIEENNSGPAIVVGHAYGNVVARTLDRSS